ncbi:MAG: enoyl-CoA hydratase-related protein [Nitrospinota bacterium]
MSYQNLLWEEEGPIATLTVNCPKVLNALGPATMAELEAAFLHFGESESLRVLVLTGAGEKAFVAGADIGVLSALGPASARAFSAGGNRIFGLLERAGKPSIAAINGFCLGGGLELAMACTLRIAAEGAKLGQPEVNLGLIPGYGGTQRLPRLIGKGRAFELILTGEMVGAEEALRMGLVNRVVPAERLMEEAKALARKLAGKSPATLHLALEAVHRGMESSLEEGLALESSLFGLACATEDMKEGTRAFLEKREPKFKGR